MKKLFVIPLIISAGFALSIPSSACALFLNWNDGHWQNWSGLYFGADFGGGSGNTDQKFNDKFTSTFTVFDEGVIEFVNTSTDKGSGKLSGDITGSKADLFVGYNFQPECANFLLGGQIEGTLFSDLTIKNIGRRKASDTDVSADPLDGDIEVSTSTSDETAERTDDLRSMISFVARGGVLVTPPVLLYVLAGLTEGHFVVPDDDDPFGGRRGKWQLGYTLGAGVEYKINDNWFLRAEYRYLNFEVKRNESSSSINTASFDEITTISTNSFSRSSTTDIDFNLGQIGIVYRF